METAKIIDELCDPATLKSIDLSLRQKLLWAIAQSLPTSNVENGFIRDLYPIDMPIEYSKDKRTGCLWIRHAYWVEERPFIPPHFYWRETQVTLAAQQDLLKIFQASIEVDIAAGRIPPKSSPHQ